MCLLIKGFFRKVLIHFYSQSTPVCWWPFIPHPSLKFDPWQVVDAHLTINRSQGVFSTSNTALSLTYSQDVSTSWSQTLPTTGKTTDLSKQIKCCCSNKIRPKKKKLKKKNSTDNVLIIIVFRKNDNIKLNYLIWEITNRLHLYITLIIF